MAVDSKPETNGTNGANGAVRAKRVSSLMRAGGALPTMDSSLEEFIAKANQTLVDVNSWEQSAQQARDDDAKRREQDEQRWKSAETQMRESDAREQSLRRQLDGLQGKLAEAEARAAVAMSSSGSSGMMAQHDAAVTDLKTQIEKAQTRMRAAEDRQSELQIAFEQQKHKATQAEAVAARATAAFPAVQPNADYDKIVNEDAEERVRVAEAKATKAIAAAKAAQAGLTVSSADIAAIESGLAVAVATPQPKAKSPVVPIAIAFVGGLVIMLLVWKLVLDKPADPGKQTAAAAAPAKREEPVAEPEKKAPEKKAEPVERIEKKAEPAQPTVTPIDDNKPTVTPIDETPKAVVQDPPKQDPPKVDPPKVDPPKQQIAPPPVQKVTPPPAQPPAVKKAVTPPAVKKAPPTIADPFGDAPKKATPPAAKTTPPAAKTTPPAAKTPPPATKPAIADPF